MLPIFRKKMKSGIPTEEEAQDIVLPAAAAFAGVTLVILLFGLTMLYSTSFGTAGADFFKRQIIWAAVGFIGIAGTLLLGAKRLSDWSPYMMLGIIILLAVADFCFPAVKGAHRWIQIPKIGSIQPSEYAKVILTLFLAKFLANRTRQIDGEPLIMFFKTAACCAPMILLVLIGRDLGTTTLLVLLLFLMCYIAGIKGRYIFPFPIIGAVGVFFYCKYFDPMRWSRLTTFLNPEAQASEEGYQLWHSLLALGSGSWFGLGFTESRLKMRYLPEAHTDFILSIVGEELGLFYMLLVIIAYLAFVFLTIRIALCARTRQGMLICYGVAAFIAMQAFINIGVISGAFPTKGMPAPFISYGGSNLVTCLTATGLVLSVALDVAYPDYQERLMRFFRQKWQQLKTYWKTNVFGRGETEKQ